MICSVEGCGTRSRTPAGKYCEKHYYRLRRTGTLNDPVTLPTWSTRVNPDGYIGIKLPKGHPERSGNGWGRQHRVVLFDAIGRTEQECHHCGKHLAFEQIVVDHLNADRTDNRLENLVASCHYCNLHRDDIPAKRGESLRSIELFYQGKKLTVAQAAKMTGLSASSVGRRKKRGMTDQEIIETPHKGTGPKRRSFA